MFSIRPAQILSIILIEQHSGFKVSVPFSGSQRHKSLFLEAKSTMMLKRYIIQYGHHLHVANKWNCMKGLFYVLKVEMAFLG